ncbi:hypothetical protein [Rhizobacter sp. Root1221]|uniref:hypothetical protein n=1 Tax=Rhizobacter sp. Root1221 TaxID=1736433 RepID=UPI0006FE0790|nr:hypothetical protein [Rhizobacter sp. Root1221]KQW02810.1 hypothetical protein ASC87_00170 [Rhizobacter sp. Root1221]
MATNKPSEPAGEAHEGVKPLRSGRGSLDTRIDAWAARAILRLPKWLQLVWKKLPGTAPLKLGAAGCTVLVVVLLAVLFVFRQDPLTKYLNAKWPPVTPDSIRAESLKANASALSRLTGPTIALSVQLGDVESALSTKAATDLGLKSAKFTADDQVLLVEVAFDRKFTEKDADKDDEKARKLLKEYEPHIAGVIKVYGSIAGAMAEDAGQPKLVLRNQVGLTHLTVQKVEVAKYDVKLLGEALAGVLNHYRDNVGGWFAQQPMAEAHIPLLSADQYDPKRIFKLTGAGLSGAIVTEGNALTVPFRFEGLAVVIGDSRMRVVAQIVPITPDTAMPAAGPLPVEPTYDGIGNQVSTLVSERFGLDPDEAQSFVAIRKDALAFALNHAVNQVGLCVGARNAKAVLPEVHQTLRVEQDAGIKCTMSPDSCRFDADACKNNAAQEDPSKCNQCVLKSAGICGRNPLNGKKTCIGGGKCILSAPDATCVASVATRNSFNLAVATTRTTACMTEKTTKSASCVAEQSAKRLECETRRETVKGLLGDGKLARIGAAVTVSSDDAKICLTGLQLSPALDTVAVSASVEGNVDVSLKYSITPMGLGHLACKFAVSDSMKVKASLGKRTLASSGTLEFVPDPDGKSGEMRARMSSLKFHPTLKPGLAELMLKSPALNLSCTGVAEITGTTVGMAPFAQELRGDFDFEVENPSIAYRLDPWTLSVKGQGLLLTTQVVPTTKALAVMAKVRRSANAASAP